MNRRAERKAFTLIELLVVIAIIGILASLLLVAIGKVQDTMRKSKVRIEIGNMMTALTEYYNEFSDYPPGGTDSNDDGDCDDAGEDFGAGKAPSATPTPIADLQLRAIVVRLGMQYVAGKPSREVGPYYSVRVKVINNRLCDVWEQPYRYLTDGRRTALDMTTGMRMPGRVDSRGPIIWSVGQDEKQEPTNAGEKKGNDNLDNNNDGKVDDSKEVGDDICSWD